MSEELKPCPWCGCEMDGEQATSNGVGSVFFECPDCGASGPAAPDDGSAFHKWNARLADVYARVSALGEYEKALRGIYDAVTRALAIPGNDTCTLVSVATICETSGAIPDVMIEVERDMRAARVEQAPPQPSEPEYDQMLHPTFARITRAAHSPVSQSATGGTFTKLVDEVIACVREYDSVDHELGAYAFVEARREKLRVARAALEAAYQQVVRDSERLSWIQAFAPDIQYQMDLRIVGIRNWHVRVPHTVGGDPAFGVSPDIREAVDAAMAATHQTIEQVNAGEEK